MCEREHIDIYILRLTKRLCNVGEMHSRLMRTVYHKMMIHIHQVLSLAIFHVSIDSFIATL